MGRSKKTAGGKKVLKHFIRGTDTEVRRVRYKPANGRFRLAWLKDNGEIHTGEVEAR